jgi:hypothetical protein
LCTGVAQRRILHRPSREREAHHHGEADQRNAADFTQPALQNCAELAGKCGHPVKAALDHRHRCSCFPSA